MKKEEYLNLISDEIKKNEVLLKETNKSINFYEKMNNIERVNEEIKNQKLYETRIKYLKGIENLPVYIKIINMTFDELNKYKNNLIEKKDNAINELNIKLKEVEKNIIENDKEINSLYDLYKQTNDNKYIEEAKYILNCIKTYKDEVELIKEQINILNHKKEDILKSNRNNIIKQLFKDNNILDMEDELKLYTPDKIDRLVVPMCNDLNLLDDIIFEMKKYIELEKEEVYETIELPRILDEYTFDDSYVSSLNWFADLIEARFNPNYDTKLEMYDKDDFDMLSNNIEYGIDKINKDEAKLENYNYILELFPTDITSFKVDDLEKLVEKLLNNIEEENYLIKDIKILVDEIKGLNIEYFNLENKFQTRNVINKKYNLKLIKNEKNKKVLDCMWFYLVEKMEEVLSRVKHNYEFYTKVENLDIEENDNKIIIQKGEYNNLNLYNTKVLIQKTLEKYNDITRELSELNEINEENKISFIKNEENIDKEIDTIVDNIDNLYKKVNDKAIMPNDYNKIISVFNNNTIIDSIVKVEREKLIDKVKVFSNNFNILELLETINNSVIEEIEQEEKDIEEPNDTKEKEQVKTEKNIKEELKKENQKENIDEVKEEVQNKKQCLDINKIKSYIEKLGIDNNTLKEMFKKILGDDNILNNVFKLDIKGILNKEHIKNIIKNINVDEYSNIYELIIDMYDKLNISNEDFMYLGSIIMGNKGLLLEILKSNRKILFNLLKSDIIKKILKK